MTPEFHFDTSHIDWMHLEGGSDFDYPVDYSLAVLSAD